MPDDVPVDQQPKASTRRRPPVLGLVCACLLALLGTAFGVRVIAERSKPKVQFCADVGLLGPPASTPEAALSAWIAEYTPRQPPESQWHRTGPTFTNRTYSHEGGYGLQSVSASQGVRGPNGETPRRADQWSIDGGCVGRP
jgi:hypothetical protein